MNNTYEEACLCPKCGLPGEVVSRVPAKPVDSSVRVQPGTQLHTVMCRNEACRWYDSPWIIQVNPDGSVPPPTTHKRGDIDKAYPKRGLPGDEQRIIDSLQRQLDAETQPGGGIVGRGGIR